MSSLVVISIVVLILAFVSAHGPNAMTEAAGLYTTGCAVWHGSDLADKIPIGQRLDVRQIGSPDVWNLSGSNLLNSTAPANGEMSALGRTLSEEETQLLVAHVHEFAGVEEWLWQPASAS